MGERHESVTNFRIVIAEHADCALRLGRRPAQYRSDVVRRPILVRPIRADASGHVQFQERFLPHATVRGVSEPGNAVLGRLRTRHGLLADPHEPAEWNEPGEKPLDQGGFDRHGEVG